MSYPLRGGLNRRTVEVKSVQPRLSREELADALESVQGMAWAIARRTARRWEVVLQFADLEDLAATVMLGFVSASRYYDPTGGKKFSSYVFLRGQHHAINWLKAYLARDNPASLYDSTDKMSSLAYVPPSTLDAADFWNANVTRLSGRQQAIITSIHVECQSMADIGRALALSRQTVREIYEGALDEIKERTEARDGQAM